MTGLATLFPVIVTILLLWQIFKFTDGLLGRALGFQIPGVGLVVTLLVIMLVGILSVHFFGRVLFQTLELAFVRLPFVKQVYPAVKQLTQFLFNDEEKQSSIRRVVLVEYPKAGSYAIAFVTNEGETTVTGTSQRLLTLLVSNPPSPFSGPIIFVPEGATIPLDLSIEDALKLVVSGGIVAAPLQAAKV